MGPAAPSPSCSQPPPRCSSSPAWRGTSCGARCPRRPSACSRASSPPLPSRFGSHVELPSPAPNDPGQLVRAPESSANPFSPLPSGGQSTPEGGAEREPPRSPPGGTRVFHTRVAGMSRCWATPRSRSLAPRAQRGQIPAVWHSCLLGRHALGAATPRAPACLIGQRWHILPGKRHGEGGNWRCCSGVGA